MIKMCLVRFCGEQSIVATDDESVAWEKVTGRPWADRLAQEESEESEEEWECCVIELEVGEVLGLDRF